MKYFKAVQPLSDLDYWKQRCLLAEAYINESPCDPDIFPAQEDAWSEYKDFVSEHGKR